MELSYHFISVTCEKSASSLTLPNTAGFLQVLQFPPVVILDFESLNSYFESLNSYFKSLNSYF